VVYYLRCEPPHPFHPFEGKQIVKTAKSKRTKFQSPKNDSTCFHGTKRNKSPKRIGFRTFLWWVCINIVLQTPQNTTYLFGEFLSQNLPNWQVFGGFKPMRNDTGTLLTFCPRPLAAYAELIYPEENRAASL